MSSHIDQRDAEAAQIIKILLLAAYEQGLQNLVDDLPEGDDLNTNDLDELAAFCRVVTSPGFRQVFDRATKYRQPGETAAGLLLGFRRAVADAKKRKKIVAFPVVNQGARRDG